MTVTVQFNHLLVVSSGVIMCGGAFYTCKELFAIKAEGNMAGINLSNEHSSGNH